MKNILRVFTIIFRILVELALGMVALPIAFLLVVFEVAKSQSSTFINFIK